MEHRPNQPQRATGGHALLGKILATRGGATGAGLTALARSVVKSRRAFAMPCAAFLAASGFTAVAIGTTAQASTAAYSMTDLGTLSGIVNDNTQAFAINGSGQIVGRSVIYKNGVYGWHAFLYSAGKMTDLGTMKSGNDSEGYAINKYGDVAGYGNTCSGCYPYDAFLYQNGKMKDLGSLGGGCSFGHGINDSAQVVGQACTSTEEHAFLYSNGMMTDLGTLGGAYSSANDISNLGQIVGYADISCTCTSGYSHAALWSNGNITDLTKYGIPTDIPATAINDSGQIIAGSYLLSSGTVTNLAALAGNSNAVAEAINNLGQVVGSPAFLYSNGQMQNLNNLIPAGTGWTLTDCYGINDVRQITCNGYNSSGYTNAFLLTPN